jgi:hypothetical protein
LHHRWNRIFSQAPADVDMAAEEFRVQNSGESKWMDLQDCPAAGRASSATNIPRQRSITQQMANNNNCNGDKARVWFNDNGRQSSADRGIDNRRHSFVERGVDFASGIASRIWRQQSSVDGREAGGSIDSTSSSTVVTKGGDTLLLFQSPEGGAHLGIGRSAAEAAANAAGDVSVHSRLANVAGGSLASQPIALRHSTASSASEGYAATAAAPDAVDAVTAAAAASIGPGQVTTHGLQNNLLRPAAASAAAAAAQRQKRPVAGVGGISFAISRTASAGEGARSTNFTAALQQEHAGAGTAGYSLAGMLKRRSSLTNKPALKLGKHKYMHDMQVLLLCL